MATIQLATPLEWPAFLPVTDRMVRSSGHNFPQDLPDHEAFVFLQDEVDRTPQIFSAVLFSNAVNVNSPMPTQALNKNPGVTLRITIDNEQYMLSCDRWLKLAHNIYTLHLTLRYFRQLEDWGIGSFHNLLAGYSVRNNGEQVAHSNAVRTDGAASESWRDFFGLGVNATLDDANAIYRYRAKIAGEDDPEQLQQLNLAIHEARKMLS